MESRADTQGSKIILPGQSSEEQMDLGVETPFGKLAAKGFRISDLMTLCCLIVVVGNAMMTLQIAKTLDNHEIGSHTRATELANKSTDSTKELTASIKESTKQQKKLVCLLSIPQEKREKEYMQPDSFCNQMANY